MNVLFINSVCGIRSTGRIVAQLAQDYIQSGHECRIAYGREEVPAELRSIAVRIGSEWNVNYQAAQARLFDNEGFNAKRATKQFLTWANTYNPDVLWLHNLHGYYLNIEMLFDWIKSRPHMQVKWTLHDCWAFTGHCSYFSFAACDRWQHGCGHCCQTQKYPASLFWDASAHNFRRKQQAFGGVKDMTLITPSKWLADLVKQSFLKEYPVEVRYNTIDTTAFCPTPSDFRERYGLTDRKIVLGVAAIWEARKGLPDFLRLATMLPTDYAVVLVGAEPFDVQDLPPSVVCISRTNSVKELAEIYTAADVFVNLTYEDNYPTVNLEAQACGTPCLTYRTGGSVESVPPDHVIEQGDLAAMVAKIQQVCLG